MDVTSFLLLVLFLVVSVIYIWHRQRDPPGLPPGPKGNFIPHMKPRSFMALADLRKQYGDVVTVWIGWSRIILLLSFKAVSEALVNNADNFSGRWRSKILSEVIRDSGIAFVDGPKWHEHRKIALRILHDFGFGRKTSETIIQHEAEQLVGLFSAGAGQPFHPYDNLMRSVSNVICSIIFGERLAYGDKGYDRAVSVLRENIKLPIHSTVLFTYPFVDHLFPILKLIPSVRRTINNAEEANDYIRSKVEEHRARLDLGSDPQDFTDAYLQEQARRNASGEPHTFTDDQLLFVIIDLFIGGTDTTANSLNWFLLMMALHPHIQERVRSEVEEVVGRDRMPAMKDKASTPYLLATLDEVHRCSSIFPIAMHRSIDQTTIHGYTIPADSRVIPCIYAVHHDPEIWPEPSQFRPERFLSPDGREHRTREELIPFGLGRRACLGESLARMEFFMFSATLVQHFTMSMVDLQPKELDDVLMGTEGLLRFAEGHEIILSKR